MRRVACCSSFILILMLAGCMTPPKPAEPPFPTIIPISERDIQMLNEEVLGELSISQTFLTTLRETAWVEFDAGCPKRVFATIKSCPPGLNGDETICRGSNGNSTTAPTIVRWRSLTGENFGIEFADTHPCTQPENNLRRTNVSQHTCTIRPQAGTTWTVLKYDVIIASGVCPLDPYLILTR